MLQLPFLVPLVIIEREDIMNKPIISVCIPTYNRANYLHHALQCILKQLKTSNLKKKIEIVISDNNSQDNTSQVVKKYSEEFKFISYRKNKKNIGIINTVKVAEFAHGEYVWFTSDDDWHISLSISTVLRIIEEFQPDAIISNLDLYSKDGDRILDPNLLRTKDNFFGGKKDFFHFLEGKFFLPIDWYLTTYSNTIVKTNIFRKNKSLFKKFSEGRFIFPHKYITFYTPEDMSIYVVAKSLIAFRADNRSFGVKDKNKFLIDWYKTLRIHYNSLYTFNKKYLSTKFSFLLYVKQSLRSLRLRFLLLFGIDISDFLVKYFYKKERN